MNISLKHFIYLKNGFDYSTSNMFFTNMIEVTEKI